MDRVRSNSAGAGVANSGAADPFSCALALTAFEEADTAGTHLAYNP